ncbi:MATE family efflux transporter [Acidovorax sp. Root275]|uniref:MATE family efflux transporter n=1 Tax=Acidovorax sp. Root275 TaxID=1736508 RepID=UPI00070B71FD|nr:MATE family efflux transporter [Acidovorax sp. Root275]KRD46269.1 MATE family efflux transporter [Acidovorax sp. Root275]
MTDKAPPHSPAPVPPAVAAPLSLDRRFLVFLGPLVLTNILQALTGTVNHIYVGRLLGAGSLAAVASFMPVFLLLSAFIFGLGNGASILVGQAFGARNPARLRAVAGTTLCAGMVLGLVLGTVGMVVARPVMVALGTPADVLPQAVVYARAMMALFPVLFTSMLTAALLRGTGDTVTPLRALVVSLSATVVLAPLFIRGVPAIGLPALGILGGVAALLLATLASLGWTAWHLRRRAHVLAPTRALAGQMRLDAALLRTLLRLGVPTGLFFITGSLADLGLLSLVNAHGSAATAAWGAASQVMSYVLFPAMAVAIASSVFAAQAIGAGQGHQVVAVTRTGMRMNLLLTGGLAVLMFGAAPWVVGLFVADARVTDIAARVLHLTVWGAVFFGWASVYSSVMRASGTVLVPTLISLGCLACLLVPLGWLLGRQFGLVATWAAYPATYLCALVLQGLYFHGVWRRKGLPHRLV